MEPRLRFGDRGPWTENAVFDGGDGHKLGDVRCRFDDALDYWRITSSDGRFEMRFSPDFDRHSRTNRGLITNVQHQVFGRYS